MGGEYWHFLGVVMVFSKAFFDINYDTLQTPDVHFNRLSSMH